MILTKEKSANPRDQKWDRGGRSVLKTLVCGTCSHTSRKESSRIFGEKWELRLLFLSSKKSINGVIAVN